MWYAVVVDNGAMCESMIPTDIIGFSQKKTDCTRIARDCLKHHSTKYLGFDIVKMSDASMQEYVRTKGDCDVKMEVCDRYRVGHTYNQYGKRKNTIERAQYTADGEEYWV